MAELLDMEGIRNRDGKDPYARFADRGLTKKPCKCGKTHHADNDTWYHSTDRTDLSAGGFVAIVVMRCKACDDILKLIYEEMKKQEDVVYGKD